MCSISWQFGKKGYDLFFTRDEQRSRAPAEAPCIHDTPEGIHYLAPTDPEGGGTWIFQNEHGVTGTLLNAYDLERDAPALAAPHSRGRLLRSLAGAHSVKTFGAGLAAGTSERPYPPCYLFAFEPSGTIGFWLWDGRALKTQTVPARQFFTTSSVQTTKVCAHRAERLRRELGQPPYQPEALEHFHRDPNSRLSAFDLRMSRPDARSVSLTHVQYRADRSVMRYAPRDGDQLFDSIEENQELKGCAI